MAVHCVMLRSSTSGALVSAGGIASAKQIRSAGKVTVSTAAGAIGLDADSYANLRVIQNATSTADGHMYIGFNGAATSSIYLYSNGTQAVRVESGTNVGIGGGSYGG